MQKLVLSNDRGIFESKVNDLLKEGAVVVPKTLTITSTAVDSFPRAEYAVVLELPITLPRRTL